jgi:hypothetical protein
MIPQAALVALFSAVLFVALVLMSDRKRGALFAQIALVIAAAIVFLAIIIDAPVAGISARGFAAFAVGLMSAAVAGMLYHLYLGRFERVWAARGVFSAVYLALCAVFGLVFLSLI